MGYLGPELSLTGTLGGSGDLRVDARFDGEVRVEGAVVVGPLGVIRGPVVASSVSVAGRVEGSVSGGDVAILEGGRITGDVRAQRVALDDGGTLDGTIEMDVDLPEEL